MLTPDGIRCAIVARLEYAQHNRADLDHTDGILRGLLWALTEKDPGTYLTADVARTLRLAGIPVKEQGDKVVYPLPGDEGWPAV
jgi:hypothetical protein